MAARKPTSGPRRRVFVAETGRDEETDAHLDRLDARLDALSARLEKVVAAIRSLRRDVAEHVVDAGEE